MFLITIQDRRIENMSKHHDYKHNGLNKIVLFKKKTIEIYTNVSNNIKLQKQNLR